MAFAVEVSPGAQRDARGAYEWYRERSTKAADSFRTELLKAFELISENPAAWSAVSGNIRRFVLKRYPYTVYFEFDGSVVWILAIGHHRQRPHVWAGR
ncbi:hypothetical protein BH11PSE9_BH11PSE9_36340 [soil metagenome]